MATLTSTGITFGDGSTAAGTALYAIGTYVTGRPKNGTNYAVNATLAGSSLWSTCPATGWRNDDLEWTATMFSNQVATLVNTGTWRCVSPAGNNAGAYYGPALWVRIS